MYEWVWMLVDIDLTDGLELGFCLVDFWMMIDDSRPTLYHTQGLLTCVACHPLGCTYGPRLVGIC